MISLTMPHQAAPGNFAASPDDDLNCLVVQPKFSMNNYWNFGTTLKTIGAKTAAPPLGLLTVAAMLPESWSISLVDLNVREITDREWEEADVICVGGMIAQQAGILAIVERARQSGKYVVVGGPDPTSQPQIYSGADALVLGEGEVTIPLWLESWRNGESNGVFESAKKPDVTNSPTPRFDLIEFRHYLYVGTQLSRGCPFNCEFCDIIELYGRVPRVKSSEQFLAELNLLYDLGHRGWVDISDDNFIGNKPKIKKLLVELAAWSKERNYPFYFSTEASMNLADDPEMLDLMRAVDFRHIFMGIETPDPDLLALTQKRVNSMKPIVERIHAIYEYGISISAGFILGFDQEKPGNDKAMIACIEDTGIVAAMVGLLTALPNTQLTRRLMAEKRLISSDHQLVEDESAVYELINENDLDQTVGGLNFVTSRDRVEIYKEFRNVIDSTYSAQNYMDRVLATTRLLNPQRLHLGSWFEAKRMLRGYFGIAFRLTFKRSTCRLYWRNSILTFLMGPAKFEYAHGLMASFLHFEQQSQHIRDSIDVAIDFATNHATYPRQVSDLPDTESGSKAA
ncbi:MAG: DUF4070 domain-containing protein [Planctomycetota bacterium]|mgnify:CR=1 FL=1|nr:DUF4070 domain-containing protein [Planctomycetota bacterium]MDA1250861.1 DUF4070 domain-containing protein [Planctomycetota bacterium]